MKPLMILLLAPILLFGCSANSADDRTPNSSETSESQKEEKTVLYHAEVKEQGDQENNRIVLKDFEPVDPSTDAAAQDEVILLMNEEIPLVDKETNTPLTIEDVKKGAKAEVTLIENAPMTMSIPPQLPGMSIVKVVIEL
ncbi:hypothetical protein [Pisciglobus halotolerans]|uniref:Lipoprotein n=1 Tax=Pisciglobus halotolerans TaxID=745365 RepID=A0A1I3BU12_9LACT|nr:hypothetical protein [Pisciglobus halotolerans]SFH65670.1 hypothetical protein SAMN04489868_10955 [Pisciglobus halotolerans]